MIKSRLFSLLTFSCCFFIIISCNKKSDAKIIIEKFQEFDSSFGVGILDTVKYNSGYQASFEYDTHKNIHRIEGHLLGQGYGHYLKLNICPQLNKNIPLGKLEEYEFKTCDGACYSYKLAYDILQKKYAETGDPQVDYFTFASRDTESTSTRTYILLFTVIPRANIKAWYSIKGSTFKAIKLTKSKSMPMVLDGELTVSKKSEVIIKTEAKNLMFDLPQIQDSKVFLDTLILK